MNASVTAGIAALVHGTADADLPTPAREAGRRALLDTVGVALAGSGEECVRTLHEVLGLAADGRAASGAAEATGVSTAAAAAAARASGAAAGPTGASGSSPDATLLGFPGRASALDAALLNGTAAHALDYDDTHAHLRGHPSASIAPAALAAAELVGATGADLVTAYVLGLEVAGRVGRSFGPSHARQGFHSSSTLGVLGAAAACARLLRLDPPQVAAALGVAASGAAGLRMNFGTMTKPLHAGNAARAGLLAALLARRGYTSAEDVLDGPGGFSAVFSPGDADPEAIGGPDGTWQVLTPGIAVKKYPCCNRGHRAADAILTLVHRYGFTASDVVRIEARMPPGEVDEAGRVGPMTYPTPTTGLQAKFSMQYVLAAAVLDGSLGIGTFTDSQVARPEARRLADRVVPLSQQPRPTATRPTPIRTAPIRTAPIRLTGTRPKGDTAGHEIVEGYGATGANGASENFVEVAVVLGDGSELVERVLFSRGDPRGGTVLSWAELAEKYRDCAEGVLPAEQLEQSLLLFACLDDLPDVGLLTAQLSVRAR